MASKKKEQHQDYRGSPRLQQRPPLSDVVDGIELFHDCVNARRCGPQRKDQSECQQPFSCFGRDIADGYLEEVCGLLRQNLVEKIQYRLLQVRDGEVRKQRKDKDRCRENRKHEKVRQNGRAIQHVVVLKFTPQLFREFYPTPASRSVRCGNAPFRAG